MPNDRAITLADIVGSIPDNYQVQYDFGANAAPTSQKTFTPPTINTDTPGKGVYNIRFVAIDASRGCNADNNAVAYLQTEVKPRPGAPTIPNAALTYCQNSTPPALVATKTTSEANLIWYDEANNVLSENTAPTPPTSQLGVQTYQVAQAIDRCEGPKARLTVTVQTTPAPTVAQNRLTYCKGIAAPMLNATGTNLRWTDPAGLTYTTAPSPSTSEVTKNADGDSYYVTQTGSNGCVSPRSVIRVFVTGPPTLALTGSTTITMGQTTALTLTFTGNGPYRYKLSNGFTATAQKDTTLLVSPAVTTIYQVAEVSNACGTGLPTSVATITVAVPSVKTLPLSNNVVCPGGTVSVNYQTTGTFNAGNTFRLRIAQASSNTATATYSDLMNQVASPGQVTGTIPATITAGTYVLFVASTNPDVLAANMLTPVTITVRAPASATLTATSTTAVAGSLVRLSVALGGEGPWSFSYRDSSNVVGAVQTVTTNASPHLIDVRPQRTTAYRLTALSNGCGNALALPAPLVVTVSPLLATERLDNWVSVYPIPATTSLTVRFAGPLAETATLELIDGQGRATHRQQTAQPTVAIPLDKQPAGIYLLRIRAGEQTTTRRVLVE